MRDHAEAWLAAGADVLVMSVGALADAAVLARLEAAARASGRSVLVSSGAIGGLDAIRAARLAGLDSVELRTTKAPRSLAGAPGIVQAGIDLDAITAPTVVFEGNASDAVAAFPANLNVVAALSLAGIGPERTRVVLVADPSRDPQRPRDPRDRRIRRADPSLREPAQRREPQNERPRAVRGPGAAAQARRGDPGRQLSRAVPSRTGNGLATLASTGWPMTV